MKNETLKARLNAFFKVFTDENMRDAIRRHSHLQGLNRVELFCMITEDDLELTRKVALELAADMRTNRAMPTGRA